MPGQPTSFDLAVIGGGPAGTAAAITAARLGAKVVLLEAGTFPRQKVCGEFVSAESLGILRNLLGEVPEAAKVLSIAPSIDQTRLWFRGRFIHAKVDPPGLSISRYDLDALLWKAAELAGVCTLANHEVLSAEGSEPTRIVTGEETFKAAAVIVAAGRWSRFTPNGSVPPGPKWLGIKAHFREGVPPSSTDLYFFQGGYCGVQAVGENAVNACAMVRSDYATSLAKVFTLDPALAERSQSWRQITPITTTSPLIYRQPTPIACGHMLVGDAAAFIDPFVGDGISIALTSGSMAATILQRSFDGAASLEFAGACYKSEYESTFTPSLGAASKLRKLMFWPRPLQIAVFEILRTPGILPHLIRRTRHG
jgi:flavin-dependent dehydrogenase